MTACSQQEKPEKSGMEKRALPIIPYHAQKFSAVFRICLDNKIRSH
jgi:hypothetical protein